MNAWTRFLVAAALCASAQPALTAERLTSVDVALGDVSLNKVSFLIAADAGIYEKNGLDVHQLLTPGAAQVARNSGVSVPDQVVRSDIGSAPISIGGGSPMIYRVANDARAIHRVVLATTESIIRDHIIASPNIKSVQDLKGKRLGYSVPGAVTHVGAVGFARKMGWEPGKDITLVGGGNALNPLLEGREDALLASGMLFAMASEQKLNDGIDLTPYKIPVVGIKAQLSIYESTEMRKYKAEDFYDSSFVEALDKSGAIDRLYK